MISKNNFALAIALALFGAASQAFAQPPATQTRPQTPATQTTSVNIPVSKVAVIFTAAFQDPKQGIARFNNILTKLNGEFQKVQDDLTQTAQKIKNLQDEISNLQTQASKGTPVDPKTIQAKIDQLDQMKKDYQRKGEDAQAQYQKRRQELFAPLEEDVAKALDVYAKGRGITMVIDGSQVEGILYAAENIDITRAFIIDYNSKNPVTAAVTTPR